MPLCEMLVCTSVLNAKSKATSFIHPDTKQTVTLLLAISCVANEAQAGRIALPRVVLPIKAQLLFSIKHVACSGDRKLFSP
eukprot:scaffold59484_cov22-Prasinocladus_malaysianus.AAC.1